MRLLSFSAVLALKTLSNNLKEVQEVVLEVLEVALEVLEVVLMFLCSFGRLQCTGQIVRS